MKMKLVLTTVWAATFYATIAQAAPIVELLFNDNVASDFTHVPSTTNMGSLGGVQNLSAVSLITTSNSPPTAFATGNAWVQNGPGSEVYSTYSLPALSDVSFAFWRRPIATSAGFYNIFTSNSTVGPGGVRELSAAWAGSIAPTDLVIGGPGGSTATYAGVLTTSGWEHVAFTYKSTSATTGILNAYIDGVLVVAPPTISGTFGGSYSAAPTGVSLSNTDGSTDMRGFLDNFFVFDTVLSQGEIDSLIATNAVPVPEPSSVALMLLGSIGLLIRRIWK